MFRYQDESINGRTWRADLVPTILAWLNGIPETSLHHLAKIRVSDIGGFVAVFRMGNSPEVHFEFDDVELLNIRSPDEGWYALYDGIAPFDQKALDQACMSTSEGT